MRKKHIEIRIPTLLDAGELLSMLDEDAGFGAWEKADALYLYLPEEHWNPAVHSGLIKALQRLGDPEAINAMTTAELSDQDWNQRWAESLRPILIGRRILVRQSWNSAVLPAGGIELVIDPKRAFGTGYHATTQLIAEWLEEIVQGGELLLDVGTGSGILAMVALRLGARAAVGIDNDPEAIECAREYAASNRFGAELTLQVAALEDLSTDPFDVVVANLDHPTLRRYLSVLHRHVKACGKICISGLLTEDHREISAALAAAGWKEAARREREEWMALELRPAGAGP